MMKKHIILFIFLLISGIIFSQKKKKEKLDTEEITVVKPYTPTVSDAFKIKVEPKIDSVEINPKKEINYSINSIPVASTFTPAKGKAKALKRPPKERFYQNFISAGFGNFRTPIVEIFAEGNTSNYNDFGGFLNYHSSSGRLEDVKLDNNFLDLDVDLFYKQTERTFKWQAIGGYDYLSTNWYGLSDKINYRNPVIKSIDEKQSYNEIYLGGEIEFFDTLVHGGKVSLSNFFDLEKSRENYGLISGLVDFPIGEEMMYTELALEFLNGHFQNNFLQTDEIDYTFFNIGFSPSFEVLRDNLTLKLGAKLYYSLTNTDEGSKFYAYPNITASYSISDEVFIAYAGVVGGLDQNSYKNFVKENPFVSPTLNIQRTSQQYNAYVGVKGLLNSNISFNAKASYGNETNKALFKLNPSKTDGAAASVVEKGYEAGNSFDVIYDDVNTIHAEGEVIIDFTKELKFGGNVEFNSYSLSTQDHAWNLPALKATLLASYSQSKWTANADVFFASNRKDELIILPLAATTSLTNATYFDVNLHGLYNFSDKFSMFVNLNNILNTDYQKYTNFKVQGFQFLLGGKFKFDL